MLRKILAMGATLLATALAAMPAAAQLCGFGFGFPFWGPWGSGWGGWGFGWTGIHLFPWLGGLGCGCW